MCRHSGRQRGRLPGGASEAPEAVPRIGLLVLERWESAEAGCPMVGTQSVMKGGRKRGRKEGLSTSCKDGWMDTGMETSRKISNMHLTYEDDVARCASYFPPSAGV